jgi:uncharacterized membrane protein/protein-disulfide isomerase
VFWRGEDKAAKKGEAGILLMRRCSLTPAAAAAARQNAQVVFESSLTHRARKKTRAVVHRPRRGQFEARWLQLARGIALKYNQWYRGVRRPAPCRYAVAAICQPSGNLIVKVSGSIEVASPHPFKLPESERSRMHQLGAVLGNIRQEALGATFPANRWVALLGVVGLVGLGVSGYLAWVAFSSSKVAGCGGGQIFDCDHVIGSRWSVWLGIPVSALAVATYVGLAVGLAVGARSRGTPVTRYAGWSLVTALAVMAGMAALWFVFLQLFVIKHLCSYCLVAHACGLLVATVALSIRPLGAKSMRWVGALSALGIGALIGGQLIAEPPATYSIETFDTPAAESTASDDSPADEFEAPDEFAPPSDTVDLGEFAPPGQSSLPGEAEATLPAAIQPEQVPPQSPEPPPGLFDPPAANTSPDRFPALPLVRAPHARSAAALRTLLRPAGLVAACSVAAAAVQSGEAEAERGDDRPDADKSSTADATAQPDPGAASPAVAPPARRLVAIQGGSIRLDVAQWPLIGSQQARHVFVEMFDYACPHCRQTHKVLKGASQKLGSELAIVALPVPLDRSCNPLVKMTQPAFRDSCALARLAIAVWRCDAQRFADFHDWMFTGPQAPSLGIARAHAATLVPEEKLIAQLQSELPGQYVARHIELYKRVGSGKIPKLLFPRTSIVGEYNSVDSLVDMIVRETQP